MAQLPSYPLNQVKKLVEKGDFNYFPRVIGTCYDDFLLSREEVDDFIYSTLLQLEIEDFVKTEPCICHPGAMIDVYRTVFQYRIYLKYYLDDLS